jgi:small subunit ribosomal protein S4
MKDRLKGSDYKHHLMEKQRLRAEYNILEKQMRNYVTLAIRRPGNPVDSNTRRIARRHPERKRAGRPSRGPAPSFAV